jgi:hypothetical protein
MKKKLIFILAVLFIALCLVKTIAYAYGYNFSFPAARRFGITTHYSGDHPAYDYSFPLHTKVAAIKSHTNKKTPCDRFGL